MARKFLGGIFETKGRANPAEAPIRAGGRALATAGMPLGNAGTWDMEKAVRDGYERVGMAFRCVDAISQTQSRLPMQRVKVDSRKARHDFEVVQDDQTWRLLNFRANGYETAAQFRYRLSATLLLSRRGAFVELVPGPSGIESLHLLAPGQVKPIPDPKTFVSGYQIMRGDSVIDEIEPERVMWLKIKPHPMDPYQQMTPLVAAGIAIETDFLARMFNRNFLMNDGRPGMLISVRGQLSDEDAKELKARYNGGYTQAGQTSVIEADGIDIADMAVNPRDMQWAEMLQGNKLDIQMAFGVPESVLGNASGRCVDDKTEAFTKRGWVNGRDLTEDDTILSVDPADGKLKWGPVREVYRNENYAGDMYRLKHNHADFLVTPGHNWLTTDGELVKVEDLNTKSRLVLMGEAEANDREVYDDAFVELVGWTVTEGHYSNHSRTGKEQDYVRIRQNEGANSDRIEDALYESGAEYSFHLADGRKLFNVRGVVAKELRQVAPGKVPERAFIDALTHEQRVLLLDTMIDGDGCRQASTRSLTFAQKDKRVSEAFVYLATLCGYSTSMRERFYNYTHMGVTKRVSDWIVIVRQRKVFTTQRNTISVEQYRGLVWCPRTDYGTFVARRDGRVCVTGNTFDNADAERENYYIDTIMPHCDPIAQGMDKITGDDNDDEVIAFDYSGVDVLQRMAARRREEKRGEFDKGLITIDEYREAAALPPFDVAGSRVLYGKSNVIGVSQNPQDGEEIKTLPLIGGGAAGPTDPAAAAQQGALAGATEGSMAGARAAANTQAATQVRARALEMFTKHGIPAIEQKTTEKARERKGKRRDKPSTERRHRRNQGDTRPHNNSGGILRDRTHKPVMGLKGDGIEMDHPYMGLRYKMEGFIEGQLTQWDSRQEDVVAERLHHVKFRKGTRHWTEEKKLPAKQKCKFCENQATKRIIHSEGRAYVPVCDKHLAVGKQTAARSTPSKQADPSNIDRVDEIKADQYLRYAVPETKAKRLNPRYAADDSEWVEEIVKSIGNFIRKAMVREARNAALNMKNDKVDKYTELDLSGRNPLNTLFGGTEKVEAALDPTYSATLDIVRKAAQNQITKLQKKIEEMDANGASIRQIEAESRKVIGARAKWRKELSVAVTTAAVEGARNMVYEKAPNIYVKQWNSSHDARVRPTHVKADNQQREPNKPFTVGGAKLMFPCDPAGPPQETINCRCYTTQELSDEYWDMVEARFDAGDDDA